MKLCLALLLMAAATVADPFIGLWRLNIAKSNYAPGQCPKAMLIEMMVVGNGVHYHSETEFTNGRKATSDYSAEYNGAEAMVTGTSGLQTPVSLKRIDANTVDARYIGALKIVATARRMVSKDGHTMTITTVSADTSGKEVTNSGVYDRVER